MEIPDDAYALITQYSDRLIITLSSIDFVDWLILRDNGKATLHIYIALSPHERHIGHVGVGHTICMQYSSYSNHRVQL